MGWEPAGDFFEEARRHAEALREGRSISAPKRETRRRYAAQSDKSPLSIEWTADGEAAAVDLRRGCRTCPERSRRVMVVFTSAWPRSS